MQIKFLVKILPRTNYSKLDWCCSEELRPQRDLSVDEAMIKFKGTLGMKQYMPKKPVKHRIKVWVCGFGPKG